MGKLNVLEEQEYETLKATLVACRTHGAAAAALGLKRTTFRYKLRRLAELNGDDPDIIANIPGAGTIWVTAQTAVLDLAEVTMSPEQFDEFLLDIGRRLDLLPEEAIMEKA